VTAAAALTVGDQYGYAVPADNSFNFLREFFMFLSGMDTPWISDGAWNFTDPAVVEAADTYRRLARDYAPQGTDSNQKREAFYNGSVAMMVDSPNIIARIAELAPPEIAKDLHVAPMPFVKPPGNVGLGMGMAAGLDPSVEAMAWQFIEFIHSQDAMSELARLAQTTVARPEANAVLQGNRDGDLSVLAAENVATGLFPASASGMRSKFPDFQSTATDVLHRLLVSDESTEDILADVQRQLEAQGIVP
jgi:ABC-type glycerol-3-phosphate transport system substrate-binding protein